MKYFNDYYPCKNGTSDISKLLNKAILDSIGDTLVIDDGDYISSTIYLQSNVSIYLSKGANIKLINDISLLYDINDNRDSKINKPTWENCEYNGMPSKYFIYGKNIENFKLYGYGSIDGNEDIFVGVSSENHIEGSFYPRVPLIFIENGKNLSFEGITLKRSAFWTLHLVGCDGVKIEEINIENNPIFTNCDGIDPDHSKNIEINNCNISCADDCIVVKNTEAYKKYGDSYNINVKNCRLRSTSAAIKFGTESFNDFHDMTFRNININNTNRGIAFMLRDGGSAYNIYFEGIKINNHQVSPLHWWGRGEPIHISSIKRNDKSNLGMIDNIIFKDIDADSENGIVIYGDNINKIGLYNVNLNRHLKTDWPHKDIDLRPSIYNVIDGEFYDLHKIGSAKIEIIDSSFREVMINGQAKDIYKRNI